MITNIEWNVSFYQRVKSLDEKFWEKVDVKDNISCWEWLASKNKKGYGNFYISLGHSKDKHVLAHRMAYMLSNKLDRVPDGLFVLHKCDNPSCVNPNHLFLGTNQDNINDMKTKGRGADRRGEKNFITKLKNQDVFRIRKLRISGMTYESIAKEYNMHLSTIWDICNRVTWNHI